MWPRPDLGSVPLGPIPYPYPEPTGIWSDRFPGSAECDNELHGGSVREVSLSHDLISTVETFSARDLVTDSGPGWSGHFTQFDLFWQNVGGYKSDLFMKSSGWVKHRDRNAVGSPRSRSDLQDGTSFFFSEAFPFQLPPCPSKMNHQTFN